MAIAARRSAGAAVLWLGGRFSATLELATVPPDKRLRRFGRVPLRGRLSLSSGSPGPPTPVGRPADFVSRLVLLPASRRPTRFPRPPRQPGLSRPRLSALSAPAGVCFSSVLWPSLRPLAALRSPPCPSFALFVDAARSSVLQSSCFSAFAHGVWVSWPIPPLLLVGPESVSISVLELLAAGVGFAAVDATLGPLSLLLFSDPLAVVCSLSSTPRAPAPRFAHSLLLTIPPFFAPLALG